MHLFQSRENTNFYRGSANMISQIWRPIYKNTALWPTEDKGTRTSQRDAGESPVS